MMYLPRPERSLKTPTQYKGFLVFATIHEGLFPLPHYCRIGDVSSAPFSAQTGWTVKKPPLKRLQRLFMSYICSVGFYCYAEGSYLATDNLIRSLKLYL
jgi:hypothetical protein